MCAGDASCDFCPRCPANAFLARTSKRKLGATSRRSRSRELCSKHAVRCNPGRSGRIASHAVNAPRRIVMLMHQSRLAPARVFGALVAIAAATLIGDIAAAKERDAASIAVNYTDLDLTRSV